MSLLNVILEGKRENLISKYSNEPIFKDNDFTSTIIDNDPSITKKYSEWAIKQVIDFMKVNSGASLPDVITQITDLINNFHDLTLPITDEDIDFAKKLHSSIDDTYIKRGPKDINRYKSYWELQTVLSAIEKKKIDREQEKEAKKDVEKIYEDNRFLIIRPFTHQASCYYGSNTKWCTTTKSDSSYFRRYGGEDGELIYIIDKESTGHSTLGKMALQVTGDGSARVWDQQDNERSIDFMMDRFEPIKKILQEIIKGDDDYSILKRVSEGKRGKTQLSANYFDRIEDGYVYLSFDDVEEYLSLFEDDVDEYELRDIAYSVDIPYGYDSYYYDYYQFDDDMREGYPLYNLTTTHLRLLKDILQMTGSDLYDCFKSTIPNVSREKLQQFIKKGNDEKDFYELYNLEFRSEECREKIAKYLMGLDEKFIQSFGDAYSYAQDESMKVGVERAMREELCNIYEDMGLVPVDENDCLKDYKISVDRLLEFYEGIENEGITLDRLLKDYVSSNLSLSVREPRELAYEVQDDETFREHFDSDVESALETLKEKLEDSEEYSDLDEYKRHYTLISNKYGFGNRIKVDTINDDDNVFIKLVSLSPEDNKISFELTRSGRMGSQFKKGRAKLSTIESLLNNYQLFDPFED